MPLAKDASPTVGSTFEGRYELTADLGRGSFSRVYLGRQLSTGQQVAVKVLSVGGETSGRDFSRELERFRRERSICAQLAHPNIVRLLDSGETGDGIVYAVFEHVPGADLARVLEHEGRLGLGETIRLMAQVLDALGCAHRQGVIHRDLKPANIMIGDTGVRRNALVLDFGLGGFAEEAMHAGFPDLTQTREIMGTPRYAAPEQLRGEKATPRSDLFAWGLVFLECLTGQRVCRGETLASVIREHEGNEPIRIPEWLLEHRIGRLLRTATARAPDERDVTVEGLMRALELSSEREIVEEIDGSAGGEANRKLRQLALLSCHLRFEPLEAEALDIEALDARMQAQRTGLAEIAGRWGGEVVASLGDRTMLAFGHPRAREDDTRRAAAAALEIAANIEDWSTRLRGSQGGNLEVRMGLHTGLVLTRESLATGRSRLSQLVGPTPELATRLELSAQPGEVLVSEEAHRLLGGPIAASPHPVADLGDVFRLAGSAEAVPVSRHTPLVGREADLAQLEAAWAQARGGSPRIVGISGDAGIGKSRLLRELHGRAGDEGWLEARCLEQNRASPLRPLIELLERLGDPIELTLERCGMDLDEHVPLFRDLLGLEPSPDHPRRAISRELQKEMTLDAIVSLLLHMAERTPIIFVFEDLHWADPSTLEFLTKFQAEVRGAQVLDPESAPSLLAVLTARPDFVPPWPAAEVSSLQLTRLAAEDVASMVRHIAGDEASESLLARVARSAEGVPLFVEEVTRAAVDLDGHERAKSESSVTLPGSLRGLMMARLDRLSPDGRETAQLASALGREFRIDQLNAVSPKDEATLREDLRELLRSELVFPRRSTRSERYLFKHALLRDAAYESMLRGTRRGYHARIAHTLIDRADLLGPSRPEILAHHFSEGGLSELASSHWKQAGMLANRQGAYLEAIDHLERGLEQVNELPEGETRDRNEVELREALGTALLSTRGYAAIEVEESFARARELAERSGVDVAFETLYGIWAVQLTRAEVEGTAELVEKFYAIANQDITPVHRWTAISIDGLRAFMLGYPAKTRAAMASWREWITAPAYAEYVLKWGYEGGIHWVAYLVWSLWILGFTDQARRERDAMLEHAESDRNPYNLAVAYGFDLILAHDMRDVEATLEKSARAIAHATEQRLPFWLAPAVCMHGWALAEQGDPEAGLGEIQEGLGLFKAIGVRATYPYLLGTLVEVHLAAGRVEEGLASVDEALEDSRRWLDRLYEAELLRLRGELLRRRGDEAGAEEHFQQALDLAGEREARAFELRAATSLARLLQDQGDPDRARAILAEVYDGFGEGLETRDLVEARLLLEELPKP